MFSEPLNLQIRGSDASAKAGPGLSFTKNAELHLRGQIVARLERRRASADPRGRVKRADF
jgi:hypothetical protein